jgi:hypothetical protein
MTEQSYSTHETSSINKGRSRQANDYRAFGPGFHDQGIEATAMSDTLSIFCQLLLALLLRCLKFLTSTFEVTWKFQMKI